MTTILLEATATFDAMRITQTVVDAEEKPLGDIADELVSTARMSIVQATRKPYDQLTPAEKRRFKETGRLPWQSSVPGEPPHTRTGKLPASIVGAVDMSQPAAVAGPTGRAPVNRTLEFGGYTSLFGKVYPVEARPFMEPALNTVSGRVLSMFEGMLENRN